MAPYRPLPHTIAPGYSIGGHKIVGAVYHDNTSIYYLTTKSKFVQEFYPHPKGLNDILPVKITESTSMDLEVQKGEEEFQIQRERFLLGAKIWQKLTQPVFLKVLDVIEAHNTVYAIREYIPGRTLNFLRKKLNTKRADELVRTISTGLKILHDLGYSPKGFSGSEIWVGERIKLMDFSAMRKIDETFNPARDFRRLARLIKDYAITPSSPPAS